MFVFYEHFVGSIPAEDVWEFCLSSDGKTNRITFVDKNEKARHALLLEFFKNIPLDVRTYDASNYISCIIGTAGKRLLTVIESSVTQGLLKGVHIKQIKDLQLNLKRGNLSYVAPKAPKATEVEIKFDEADFFKKSESKSSELSGDALYAALAGMLGITVANLKILSKIDMKSIYRRKAMELHPDKNNGDGSKMAELNYLWRIYHEQAPY